MSLPAILKQVQDDEACVLGCSISPQTQFSVDEAAYVLGAPATHG
jgi:hypothetical protein